MADGTVTVEGMSRERRQIVLCVLICGVFWQITRIVHDLIEVGRPLPAPLRTIFVIVQLVGLAGCIVSLFRFSSFTTRLNANSVLAAAVGDEFYQQVRQKATVAALYATLYCQAGLIVASIAYPLGAVAGADITIFVAGVTGFATFLRLDRG